MAAKLTAFVFDETAMCCIEQCPYNQAGKTFDQETHDAVTQLNEPVILNNRPDGDYILLVQGNPFKSPDIHLSLLTEDAKLAHLAKIDLCKFSAAETSIRKSFFDTLSIDNDDESDCFDDSDGYAMLDRKILKKRAEDMGELFKPLIENNPAFNERLVKALDYLMAPAINAHCPLYDDKTNSHNRNPAPCPHC